MVNIKKMYLSKRNSRLRLTVILNILLRMINIGISIVLVPLLLVFLGKEKYGIWVTISVVVNWLNMFDVGLGQGLKLKLTEAFSFNRVNDIKKLISSTYFLVSLISLILALIFFIGNFIFSWSQILNINNNFNIETDYSVNILILFFLLVLLTKLIGVIYSALQLPFIDNVVNTMSQVFFLLLVVIFNYFDEKSSLIIVSLFSIFPLFFIYLLFNIHFFKFKSPSLIPKIKNVSKDSLRQVFKPGINFFIIQVGCIVLYTTDNLIILNLLSANDVADYSIYYKYYSFPFVFFNLYIASHWSAFIDALAKKDFVWIKTKIKFFNKSFVFLVISYVFLFFYIKEFFNLWLGDNIIKVDYKLSFYMIIYFLISSYVTIYMYVINAFGKLKVQMLAYIIIAIVNIPLSILLVRYFNMKASGVILASSICLSILLILIPVQYLKIIKEKVSGIWMK